MGIARIDYYRKRYIVNLCKIKYNKIVIREWGKHLPDYTDDNLLF